MVWHAWMERVWPVVWMASAAQRLTPLPIPELFMNVISLTDFSPTLAL